MNIKNSFTIIELLVVIAIIAILSATLAPAIMTAWSKSYINKAKSEMPGLANIGTMIKLDTGYYVMLADFDNIDTVAERPTDSYDIITLADDAVADTDIDPDLTADDWDGPYKTFQSGETATTAAANGTFSAAALPSGTPLDPWGVPYGMCWDNDEKVMVIYSAGPNGTFETSPGATNAAGDDIIYKFK